MVLEHLQLSGAVRRLPFWRSADHPQDTFPRAHDEATASRVATAQQAVILSSLPAALVASRSDASSCEEMVTSPAAGSAADLPAVRCARARERAVPCHQRSPAGIAGLQRQCPGRPCTARAFTARADSAARASSWITHAAEVVAEARLHETAGVDPSSARPGDSSA